MNVLQAVWEPRAKIGLTVLLLIMTQYVFAVIGYWIYHTDYSDNSCNSLSDCLVSTIDNSFKASHSRS